MDYENPGTTFGNRNSTDTLKWSVHIRESLDTPLIGKFENGSKSEQFNRPIGLSNKTLLVNTVSYKVVNFEIPSISLNHG